MSASFFITRMYLFHKASRHLKVQPSNWAVSNLLLRPIYDVRYNSLNFCCEMEKLCCKNDFKQPFGK